MRASWGAVPSLGVSLLVTLFVVQGAAGQAGYRSGFWLEVGTGAGTVRNTCAGCPDVTVAYGSVNRLRLGATLTPRVLLGVEIFSLHSSELVLADGAAPVEAENGSIAPVIIWYVGGSGFYLKGGAGLAQGTFTVRSASGEAITTERTGSGLTFGLGFEIGVVSWLALTAEVGSYVTAIGDVRVDGTFVDDVIATVYEAGVGLAWR